MPGDLDIDGTRVRPGWAVEDVRMLRTAHAQGDPATSIDRQVNVEASHPDSCTLVRTDFIVCCHFTVHQHFDLRGAVMTEDLLKQMDEKAARAARSGAVGGAQLARQQQARAARYNLAR